MDVNKQRLSALLLILLPIYVHAQEWSKSDSIRLKEMLQSDKEININREMLEFMEPYQYHQSYLPDYDNTLPKVEAPIDSLHERLLIRGTYKPQKSMLYSPNISTTNYSLRAINSKMTLHSCNNFGKSTNHFQVHTTLNYRISPRWSMRLSGSQNLYTRKQKGLPSEVEPTSMNSSIVYKVNKHWEIKSGASFQHNTIQRKWEWRPEIGVSFRW